MEELHRRCTTGSAFYFPLLKWIDLLATIFLSLFSEYSFLFNMDYTHESVEWIDRNRYDKNIKKELNSSIEKCFLWSYSNCLPNNIC